MQLIYSPELESQRELTENSGLSRVVKANDNDAHLFCADEAAEELREQKSHF